MKTPSIFILVFSLTATIVSTFNTFVPSGKEVIYSWKATVKAGTFVPARYASQFVLHGNIHLQFKNDSLLVKVTNLTQQLYNGLIDGVHEHQGTSHPLPEQVHDLKNIFRIVYDKEGTVKGIGTEKEEKQFSRNIKKAIATILQVNTSIINEKYHQPETFITQENSIYGYGNEIYSVFLPTEKKFEVHKSRTLDTTNEMFLYFLTNTEPAGCDVPYDNLLTRSSLKKYFLTKQNNSVLVEKIKTAGSVQYYPFQAKSEGHVIVVIQNFDLIDVVPQQQEFHIKEEHFEKGLNYYAFTNNEDVLDGTNGRRVHNHERTLAMVKELLEDISQYLKGDHFNTAVPDVKTGQLINRVQRIFFRLTIDKLKELQQSLPQESLQYYYKILPLVGTDASTIYIKDLIVDKVVEEQTAISMLQHFAENPKPSVELLTKLEQLIQLDSSFSWDLRKVAVLSFGSIIHKSYVHYSHLDSSSASDLQQPYKKYVDKYIDKVRNSSSYQTQAVYLQGLQNMKLPILVDELAPAFNGEWFQDRNLRLYALWTASSSVISHFGSEKVIETLWPIFINRDEATELRIMSYSHIVRSKLSLSVWTDILTFMLTEPDEDLYHYHYTFFESLMRSTESCHQQFRTKLAKVIKFSPPSKRPYHEDSRVHAFGFQDAHYSFGAGAQNHIIKTNESRIYLLVSTTQQFNVFEEESLVYVKVRDSKEKATNLVDEFLALFTTKSAVDDHFLVEISFVKRGQISNSFIFDKHNVGELMNIFSLFTSDNGFFNTNYLDISYKKYYSALIPIDLGIPGIWEYLMPEIQNYDIKTSKETSKESVNFWFDYRYVNWIHYSHGLSFYNPVTDVWQGINSYHSVDAALPLQLNISYQLENFKYEVSWKKHNESLRNIAGIKTHAQQVVFVRDRDDYETKVLSKFQPNGEEFQVVSAGKKYRHDYPLIVDDNLDTGHKLSISFFDTETHVSLGAFKKSLYRFTDFSTKYASSPFGYLGAVYLHFQHAVILAPHPINHGFLLRIEPSEKFGVNQIDFSLTSGESKLKTFWRDFLYMTYSVRNNNKILKTWTLKPSKTRNFYYYKAELTRILPEEIDRRLAIGHYKYLENHEIKGRYFLKMGDCINDECVYNVLLYADMNGKRSLEQLSKNHRDASCQHVAPNVHPYHRGLECWLSIDEARHYTYKVDGTITKELNTVLVDLWDMFKRNLYPYYTHSIENNDLGNYTYEIDIVYPQEEPQVDVSVLTSEDTSRFFGIPIKIPYIRDYLTFNVSFINNYRKGPVDQCVVYNDKISLNKISKFEAVPNEWTPYDEVEEGGHLYLKLLNNTITLKVVSNNSSLEIIPDGETYQIVSNGAVIPLEGEFHNYQDKIHYFYTEQSGKVVMVFLEKSEILVEFQSQLVIIDIVRRLKHTGACHF